MRNLGYIWHEAKFYVQYQLQAHNNYVQVLEINTLNLGPYN